MQMPTHRQTHSITSTTAVHIQVGLLLSIKTHTEKRGRQGQEVMLFFVLQQPTHKLYGMHAERCTSGGLMCWKSEAYSSQPANTGQ